MRRREDFLLATRRGRRARRSSLVLHYLPPEWSERQRSTTHSPPCPPHPAGIRQPALVGFVVGRSIGNSVVRHRVTRRLRHLVRDRLSRVPDGSLMVVRALPPAAGLDSRSLGRDLDIALDRVAGGPR